MQTDCKAYPRLSEVGSRPPTVASTLIHGRKQTCAVQTKKFDAGKLQCACPFPSMDQFDGDKLDTHKYIGSWLLIFFKDCILGFNDSCRSDKAFLFGVHQIEVVNKSKQQAACGRLSIPEVKCPRCSDCGEANLSFGTSVRMFGGPSESQ